MTRALNILTQLQSALTMKTQRPEIVNTDEMFGPGFVSQYSQDAEDSDVPNVADTRTYTTHKSVGVPKGKKGGSNYLPFENEGTIIEKEEDVNLAAPKGSPKEMDHEDIGADPGTELDTGTDNVGGMDNMAGMDAGMGDMGGMGMGMEEEPKTAGELGRIYELKKIYSRLTSIESYLSDEAGGELSNIRNHVSQGIELFEIVSSNFDSYKDKLDEIIIMYYKFIVEVYNSVRDFYKKEAKSGGH